VPAGRAVPVGRAARVGQPVPVVRGELLGYAASAGRRAPVAQDVPGGGSVGVGLLRAQRVGWRFRRGVGWEAVPA
jgi:hypothetical protein